MKTLSIIIPFLNEAKTLSQVLEKIIHISNFNLKKEIILINDWSTDNSEKIIAKYLDQNIENTSFISIKNDINRWKWFSLKEWLKQASWDYFIIQDGDLEYDPNDYIRLIDKLEHENLDFVYWSRNRWFYENWFTYSYISFLLWWLLISILTSLFSFKMVTDEPTCYKLFTHKLKKYLLIPTENGFEWEPAITILLLKNKCNYWEIWIKYFPRKSSEWKKIKWIDWLKAIITIIKRRFNK